MFQSIALSLIIVGVESLMYCSQGAPTTLLDSTILPISWRILNPPSTLNFQHTFGFTACPTNASTDSICISPTTGSSDPLISALEVQLPAISYNTATFGFAFDASMTALASTQDLFTETGLGMAFGIALDSISPGYSPFGPGARYSSGGKGVSGQAGTIYQPLLTALRFSDLYTCVNYPAGMYGGAAGCLFYTTNVTTTQRQSSPVVANYLTAKFYWDGTQGLLYAQQMSINQTVISPNTLSLFNLFVNSINYTYNVIGNFDPPSRLLLYSERTNITVSQVKLTYSSLQCSSTTSSSTKPATTTSPTTLTPAVATGKATVMPTRATVAFSTSSKLPTTTTTTTMTTTTPTTTMMTATTPSTSPKVISPTIRSTIQPKATSVVALTNSTQTNSLSELTTTESLTLSSNISANTTQTNSTSELWSTASTALSLNTEDAIKSVASTSSLTGLGIGEMVAIAIIVLICVVMCAVILACRRSLRKNYICRKFCSVMPAVCNDCFPCPPPESSEDRSVIAIQTHISRVLSRGHDMEADDISLPSSVASSPSLPATMLPPPMPKRTASIVYDRVILPDATSDGYSSLPARQTTGYDMVRLPKPGYDGVDSHLD
jgi:hypothetical protein